MKSSEELVKEFREAVDNLPEEYKLREIERAYCLVKGKKFIVLEDFETGKLIKFLDVKNLKEYLWRYKQIKADRSYIYRVLRGQCQTLYGYKIYYEEIN